MSTEEVGAGAGAEATFEGSTLPTGEVSLLDVIQVSVLVDRFGVVVLPSLCVSHRPASFAVSFCSLLCVVVVLLLSSFLVVQSKFDSTRESVTRLLYVGEIPKTTTKQEICDYHKSFLTEIGADVSGLMLLQSTTFLNLIEATPDVIIALLRHMQLEMENAEAPCIANVRVVANTEDCPTRAFVSWSYRSVSLPPQASDLGDTDIVTSSFNMYHKLVQLGQHLTDADLTPADISAALDSLKQKYAQYLPSNELVAAFSVSEDVASLEEYLELFDSPVDVELEDEKVWPPPEPINFLA